MPETYEKIDDQTVKITETFDLPEPVVTEYDRAELQTELDHLPDSLVELQEQVGVVKERETELIEILKVFE